MQSMRTLRTFFPVLLSCILTVTVWAAPAATKEEPKPTQAQTMTKVMLETSKGNIVLELDNQKAPISVANFVKYANAGTYNNTIFHRVIPGFMVQGGGFESDMSKKSTNAPIRNESTNGLGNKRGTIAMARTNDPDSATNQFFINLIDNDFLDGSKFKPGYAVFGKVTSGMDVVDAIARVKTGKKDDYSDVPVEPVIIKTMAVQTSK